MKAHAHWVFFFALFVGQLIIEHDWDDRKSTKGVIPSRIADPLMHHSTNRNSKHVSVAACTTAAEESLIRCIIPFKCSTAIGRYLIQHCGRFGTDFISRVSPARISMRPDERG
jgi:hypothetical protein